MDPISLYDYEARPAHSAPQLPGVRGLCRGWMRRIFPRMVYTHETQYTPEVDMTKCAPRNFHLTAALFVLVGLCWFAVACGSDEPEDSGAPDYEATVAAALAKAGESAPTMQPTATPDPTPQPTPTEIPPSTTATAAPAATPAAGDAEPLAPLSMEDPNALLAGLSDAERQCVTTAIPPERLAASLQSPESVDAADSSALLGCLEHDIALRLFLTQVLTATGPLRPDSSACLRRSYADTDLHAMMADPPADAQPGSPEEAEAVAFMVAFVVSLSCLSEDEFQVAAPAMGMAPEEYENFQCVLEKVGGQDALTALLTPAAEFPAALFGAAAECQLQMAGPPPG